MVTAPTADCAESREPEPPLKTLTPFSVAVLREILVVLATVTTPVGLVMVRPKMLS
ncbi:hypothetical protein D3C80_2201990 [compost metagenome]